MIHGTTDQTRIIGTPGDIGNLLLMVGKLVEDCESGEVVYYDGVIFATRGQLTTIV